VRSSREYDRHVFGKQQLNLLVGALNELSVLRNNVITDRNCCIINEVPVNAAAIAPPISSLSPRQILKWRKEGIENTTIPLQQDLSRDDSCRASTIRLAHLS